MFVVISSWNVNSLRSCETKFLAYLNEYSPDIIGIQELRANESQLSMFLKLVSGYRCLFNDSGTPGYAGTALYYKENLKLIDLDTKVSNYLLNQEGRLITFSYNDVVFFNFYIPNGNASETRLTFKLAYYAEILKLSKELLDKGKKVVILGDLNVAHKPLDVFTNSIVQSGCLPQERKWFTDMLELGFIDTFRMFNKEGGNYSWWNLKDPTRSQNRGWRYDYILVSESLRNCVKSAGINKEVFGSDHCPVWVDLEI